MKILGKVFFVAFFLEIGIFTTANAEELLFKVGRENRDLILEYPKNSANIPVPLVLIFHGGGGNSSWMQRHSSELQELLLKDGYAVAFMDGTGRFLQMHTWNGEHCCGYAAEKKIDDVGYIDAAIDNITEKYLIDESNIFLVGHSNGGMIVYRAAGMTRHAIKGAIGVSTAVFVDQPAPKRSFSLLMVHAKDDEVVPYTGGMSTNKKAVRTQTRPYMAFDDGVLLWKKHLHCGRDSQKYITNSVLMRSANCADGNFIRALQLETGGHEWNKKIEGISMPKIILQFMQEALKN